MDGSRTPRLRTPEPGGLEVVARLRGGVPTPDALQVVSRFGHVVTGRLTGDDVDRVAAHPAVASLQAPRPVVAEPAPAAYDTARGVDAARRRPFADGGRGVIVGVLDWGFDFTHPNLHHDGHSRILALWDQRAARSRRSPLPYGYGTLFSRTQINAALASASPYEALNYYPSDSDRAALGAHGTHVCDIAAGHGNIGPGGLAPGADLVLVHLADSGTSGRADLGDSVRLLEAIDFVRRVARDRPVVINLSVGRHAGPHDASTPVERAVDWLLERRSNTLVVQSAGNYFQRGTHAARLLRAHSRAAFGFVVHPHDLTPNELEVWVPAGDEFEARLVGPGSRSPWLRSGSSCRVLDDGVEVGRLFLVRRDPDNGDQLVNLLLGPMASPGLWRLELRTGRIVDGRAHGWLERDDVCGRCQAHFTPDIADSRSTIGTLASARLPLVVGAYDARRSRRPVASFSSSGPTRDGRSKPDLVAPGVAVVAARSRPAATAPAAVSVAGLVTKSGTSMAAPHVTGAVAACLGVLRRPISARELRALVLEGCEPAQDQDPLRVGAGYLDPAATLALARLRDGEARRRGGPLSRLGGAKGVTIR